MQYIMPDCFPLCNSATFRKMFPEYVDKYNQQQQQQQQLSPEQVPMDTSEIEDSKPLLEKANDSAGDVKRVDDRNDGRKDRKQSIPTWMMLLLFSVFGLVMALPLLQL